MQTSLNNTMATTHDDSEQFDDTEQQGGIAWRETALIIVSLIAIAALAMLWINRLPAEGSSEVVFARDMIAHHEQAVEMAAYLNQRLDTDEGMRLFTFDMMISQKGQIGQMQGWLQAWGHPLASGEPPMQGMGEHMGMASREQVQALETLPIEEAEIHTARSSDYRRARKRDQVYDRAARQTQRRAAAPAPTHETLNASGLRVVCCFRPQI